MTASLLCTNAQGSDWFLGPSSFMSLRIWVVVKIMVPVWVLTIVRHLVFREPYRGSIILRTTHIPNMGLNSGSGIIVILPCTAGASRIASIGVPYSAYLRYTSNSDILTETFEYPVIVPYCVYLRCIPK